MKGHACPSTKASSVELLDVDAVPVPFAVSAAKSIRKVDDPDVLESEGMSDMANYSSKSDKYQCKHVLMNTAQTILMRAHDIETLPSRESGTSPCFAEERTQILVQEYNNAAQMRVMPAV